MIKCAIFDFDGTLVNTETDVIYCMNEALMKNSYPVKEYDYIKGLIGKNLDEIVMQLLPGDSVSKDNIDRVKDSYKKIYSDYNKPNTIPFSGIKELLQILKDNSIYVAVNSNKGQELLLKMTEDLFGQFFFDRVVGYNPDYPSKPDPYGVLKILKDLSVSSEEAVYIGDSAIDIITAQNAGIPILCASWGIGDNQEMMDKYGVTIYNSTIDLYERIIK